MKITKELEKFLSSDEMVTKFGEPEVGISAISHILTGCFVNVEI